MKYYTVYKIKNKINDKIYIGCHKTENLDDNYMGSGIYLRRAIDKYGIDNFEKRIMFVYDNPYDMFSKEAEIVTESFVERKDNYNLKIGGMGGFDYINRNKLGLIGFWNYWNNLTSEQLERHIQLSRQGGFKTLKDRTGLFSKKSIENRISSIRKNNENWTFGGMKHSKKSKEKMSNSAKKRLKDPMKHSQYGTMWIYSLDEKRAKKIKRTDNIPNNCIVGRKPKKQNNHNKNPKCKTCSNTTSTFRSRYCENCKKLRNYQRKGYNKIDFISRKHNIIEGSVSKNKDFIKECISNNIPKNNILKFLNCNNSGGNYNIIKNL
ncbi:hypothetical protein PBI_SCTP2_366 [Salicola phage SCTP-2]|nr:hypothetical protein PBI_SCTP2_366 [Salicola phage SCTP-2]